MWSRAGLVTSLLVLAWVQGCTELPPAQAAGAGGEGGHGAAGFDGGGEAGRSGTGGEGGLADCPTVAWVPTPSLETFDMIVPPIDDIEFDVATGSVSVSTDPIDEWLIESCDGRHDIILRWDLVTDDSELNLRSEALAGSLDCDRNRCTDRLAGVPLNADEPFLVTVEAVDTTGVSSLSYNLWVVPVE